MADPYLSEIKYLGSANLDFIEVTVDAGTDVSGLLLTIYNSNGTVRSSSDLSVLTPVTVNGKDIYVIRNGDATNFNGVALSNAVALSDSSGVYQFVSFDDTAGTVTATAGPANGMTSSDVGIAGSGSSLETDDGGTSYYTQTTPTPGSIPCLTAGTLIVTNAGPVKVEDLAEGAMILTLDEGYKPLRMVMSRTVSTKDLRRNDKLRPVRICAGALGPGLPKEDLLVSRQHRMLVSSAISQRMFNCADVLVAAIHLTQLPGIFVDHGVRQVEYFHLLFEDHEVIFANGAPTESLLLGPHALASLPEDTIEELATLFPDLCIDAVPQGTRFAIPHMAAQKRLVFRHAKNARPLVARL